MQVGSQIRHYWLDGVVHRKCRFHDDPESIQQIHGVLRRVPGRLPHKKEPTRESDVGQALIDIEPLVLARLHESRDVLEVHALYFLPCARPQFKVEGNGAICNDVGDRGVAAYI